MGVTISREKAYEDAYAFNKIPNFVENSSIVRGTFQASSPTICNIVPPHITKRLEQHPDHGHRLQGQHEHGQAIRQRRVETITTEHEGFASYAPSIAQVLVYDAVHHQAAGGRIIDNDKDTSPTANVHNAFTTSKIVLKFLDEVFQRKSIDGKNYTLKNFINYGKNFNNAFWNGKVMCYGNGDNVVFTDLTKAVDVGAHETAHGFTQYTSNLVYNRESGQNNESVSDVFGSMVKQWSLQQNAEDADWLIGSGIIAPPYQNQALRSMKAPGTAYNNDALGKDPQPASWPDALKIIEDLNLYDPNNKDNDNGGVHILSSIGNLAFYKVSVYIAQQSSDVGKKSWEKAGWIWYLALTNPELVPPTCSWEQFAQATVTVAANKFGKGSMEWQSVQKAWTEVGILKVGNT